MKRIFIYFLIVLSAVSCRMAETAEQVMGVEHEMSFHAGFKASVVTKGVSEIVSPLSGIFVTALSSDGTVYGDLDGYEFSCSQGSDTYTGKTAPQFWPKEGTLSFFAIVPFIKGDVVSGSVNYPMDPASGDVVYAHKADAANGEVCSLVFDHPMARLYDIVLSTQSSAVTATITSLSIQPKYVDGILNGSTGVVAGGALSSQPTAITPTVTSVTSEQTSLGPEAIDRVLVPGVLTVKVSYDVTLSGIKTSYNKTATVSLKAGDKSTIVGVLPANADEIEFSVVVNPWVDVDVPAEFVD